MELNGMELNGIEKQQISYDRLWNSMAEIFNFKIL